MIKLHDISNYSLKSTDVFFFDNNVWMYLFCPIANTKLREHKKYSSFLKQIKTIGATIWINALVLSEFSNSWLRIEYNRWRRLPENRFDIDYKLHFVNSPKYLEVIDEIKQTIPVVLKQTERASDNFNAINIDKVLSELENCDFNDSYYLALAELNNWKIVTHDADLFKNNNLNIEIITANNKIV